MLVEGQKASVLLQLDGNYVPQGGMVEAVEAALHHARTSAFFQLWVKLCSPVRKKLFSSFQVMT